MAIKRKSMDFFICGRDSPAACICGGVREGARCKKALNHPVTRAGFVNLAQ